MAVFNAPKSWHDIQITYSIYQQLYISVPNGFYLISDIVFPCGN